VQFFLGDGYIGIGWKVATTIAKHKDMSTELTILTEKEATQCTPLDMGFYGHLLKLFVTHCPDTLSGLTRLKLENLRLLESDFHELFGLFKQLEFLRLDNCGMKFPSLLEVEHPRLRELEILRSNFETVDLKWLPELRTLTFSCWLPQHDDPLSFGHVPLLHTVSISNKAGLSHKMLKLSEFLRKATLSNLHVNFQSEKVSYGYDLVDDARRFSRPYLYEVVVFNMGNIFCIMSIFCRFGLNLKAPENCHRCSTS
jgi:hypothetical protein